MEEMEVPCNISTIKEFNEWLKGDDILFRRAIHKKSGRESFNFHHPIGYKNEPFDDGNIYYHREDKVGFQKFKLKNLRRLFKADVYRY